VVDEVVEEEVVPVDPPTSSEPIDPSDYT